MATLYAKLGVSQDATSEEIKRAYRKAAMKWHPDRNAGQEEVARAAFQDIKDAYAILSDDNQRKIYDAVYAQEMRQYEALERRRREVEAAQARKAKAEAEAKYTQMVGVAMRYADEGHNRDVLFGVLLGRDCDTDVAQRIADSVWALQQSRRAAQADESAAMPDAGCADPVATATSSHEPIVQDAPSPPQPAAAKHDKPVHEPRAAGLFDSLWQGFFGVRS
ncbi:J domain-containing protein [Paraburkholderia caribensis]|uniref:J domain-containing protein n=1 Tax=Paraburkholderia caribensis TaxID=75105 RepID=UPI00078D6F7F|nr:J domain-containing protein [Paraburkholderia caribensis]AMV42535.1 molecular chaperone DnaJ [Paraburkholderia caribensis]